MMKKRPDMASGARWRLSVAKSAKPAGEAARALIENNVDLLLLDVNLPGISGLEFLKQLQTESENNKTEAPL
jgi:DNA-binding response OmpR family regulator